MTALQTSGRCVPLCVLRPPRLFFAVQAALQTATNRCTGSELSVATSWLVVGAGENSDAAVESIPVAMVVQFAH